VRKTLAEYDSLITVQLFSATNGTGLEDIKVKLDSWFEAEDLESEEE
jgi:hypothetical protein